MRDERVPLEVLQRYQRQMIAGHACGIGAPLDSEDVRAAMLARVSGAARGGSGLTLEAVQLLVAMLNAGVHPIVPSAGSVGAGDLMHMAAIAVVMIGLGEAELNGELLPGGEALARAGLDADRRAAQGGPRARELQRRRDRRRRARRGRGTAPRAPGRPGLRTLARGHARQPGPLGRGCGAPPRRSPGRSRRPPRCARCSQGSYLHDAETVLSVQDPLSFRVAAQVNGAYREQVTAAEHAVEVELNGIGDNPMVVDRARHDALERQLPPDAADARLRRAAHGAAHVAMISERRMNKVFTLRISDPRLMLAGLDDDEMAGQNPRRGLVQYAAAALLAELKHLTAPVSIHLPPLDLDVEDHGTLAPSVVFTTRRALDLLDTILSCEVQMAIDLMLVQGVPRLGRGTQAAYDEVTAAWARLPATAPPAARGRSNPSSPALNRASEPLAHHIRGLARPGGV